MIEINLVPKKDIPQITCSQADTTLRKWEFKLIHNDAEYVVPSGTSITFECSNGATSNATYENGIVYVDCNESISSKDGVFFCKLKMKNGNEILSTERIKLWVEKQP